MSQLLALFCESDDFCTWCEPLSTQRLLPSGQRQRPRQTALALSEIMTLIGFVHSSHDRDVKHSSPEEVEGPLRPSFPALVSSSRFVALMPRPLVPLCGSRHTRPGRCTGIPWGDAPSLAVGPNRRISRHKGCEG